MKVVLNDLSHSQAAAYSIAVASKVDDRCAPECTKLVRDWRHTHACNKLGKRGNPCHASKKEREPLERKRDETRGLNAWTSIIVSRVLGVP